MILVVSYGSLLVYYNYLFMVQVHSERSLAIQKCIFLGRNCNGCCSQEKCPFTLFLHDWKKLFQQILLNDGYLMVIYHGTIHEKNHPKITNPWSYFTPFKRAKIKDHPKKNTTNPRLSDHPWIKDSLLPRLIASQLFSASFPHRDSKNKSKSQTSCCILV